jgi:hypothetical protein
MAWLRGGPPLEDLRTVFPRETATVERQIEELLASEDGDQLASFAASLARPLEGGMRVLVAGVTRRLRQRFTGRSRPG